MPLPDERPRQSVANLIGRFEQQNKRHSAAASVPPHSSSVASQPIGDAAKDVKEKREWPPKPKLPAPESMVENTPVSPYPPAYAPLPELAPVTGQLPESEVEEEPAPVPIPPTSLTKVSTPTPPSSPPKKNENVAEIPRASARPPSTPHGRTQAPVTPSKTRGGKQSAANSKPSTRTPAKGPPSSFHPSLSTSASVPTPPSRPSSRASGTPSRPKTPSSRAKTPSSVVSPSKFKASPTTGLFAPTAASLARARAGDTVPPPPTRKQSDPATLQRLSRPTAASQSKARQPTLPTPAKVTPTKAIPARTTATRGVLPAGRGGALMKPRVGIAVGKEAAAAAAGAATGVAAVFQGELEYDNDEIAHEVMRNEEVYGVALVDEPEHHEPEEMEGERASQEHPEDMSHEDVALQAEDGSVTNAHPKEVITEPQAIEYEESIEDIPHADVQVPHIEVADDVEPPSDFINADDLLSAATEVRSEAAHSETETHVSTESDIIAGSVGAEKSGNDLEDMVKLLEAPVSARSMSVVDMPDEVADIPDED